MAAAKKATVLVNLGRSVVTADSSAACLLQFQGIPEHAASTSLAPSGRTLTRGPDLGHEIVRSASNTSYWYVLPFGHSG